MSKVMALVPARTGSRGIPGKNFRVLGDRTLVGHAVRCARDADCDDIFVSSDDEKLRVYTATSLHAPAPLHTGTCPMIDVVKDALKRVPGEPDDIWVLLQPTQPFRTPEHVKHAVAMLRELQEDSVVSVKALPRSHHPQWQFSIDFDGTLKPFQKASFVGVAPRRQDLPQMYTRDGTVYVFWRKTVEQHGNIYGDECRPLIIPAHETCELDTLDDWAAVEARWNMKTQESYATQGK